MGCGFWFLGWAVRGKREGRKEEGKGGVVTCNRIRVNLRGFAAKGPPAPERPFAYQSRASGADVRCLIKKTRTET